MTALWHAYNAALDATLIHLWIWSPVWIPLIWSGLAARALWIWRKR